MMNELEELIKELENFAKENQMIKDFLNIFTFSNEEERKNKWEEFKKNYCSRVEDKLKEELEKYLRNKGYNVSTKKKDVKLSKKFFEVDTYTDLKLTLNKTRGFIELKLNHPPKKGKTSFKKWGYEEFIALKEKYDYVESDGFLILFIVDAIVRRKLDDDEKIYLKKQKITNKNIKSIS